MIFGRKKGIRTTGMIIYRRMVVRCFQNRRRIHHQKAPRAKNGGIADKYHLRRIQSRAIMREECGSASDSIPSAFARYDKRADPPADPEI